MAPRTQLLRFAFEPDGLHELSRLNIEFVQSLLTKYDQAKLAFLPTPESRAFAEAIAYWNKHSSAMPAHAIDRLLIDAEQKVVLQLAVKEAMAAPFVLHDLAGLIDNLTKIWAAAAQHRVVSIHAPTDYSDPLANMVAMIDGLEKAKRRADSNGRTSVIDLADMADQHTEEMARLWANPERAVGFPTGFETFDRSHGGLYRQQMTVIAARMKRGKSTLMLTFLITAWLAGCNVMLINKEMNMATQMRRFAAIQIARRLNTWGDNIQTDLKFARMTEEQLAEYVALWEGVKEHPSKFFITDPAAVCSIADARRVIRRHKLEHGLDIVAIDSGNSQEAGEADAWNMSDKQRNIVGELSTLCKEFDVHVLVDVQDNRSAEENQNAGVGAIGLSDAWAQQADNVLRIWDNRDGTGELQVLATRDGASGERIPIRHMLGKALLEELPPTSIS